MSAPVRRATRTDVARLAGTSTAVVSYVINNGPRRVSPERRERVLAAMKQLGYQPNAIARSLSSTETMTLGMIVPNISNVFFAELALAVEVAALRRGRLLFLGNSNESHERESAYLMSFLQQRVDGIVIVGVTRGSSMQKAIQAGTSVVVLDRELAGSGARTVSIDHRRAAYEATSHLLSHGHRRVACLTGPADQVVAEERRQGWADAIRVVGLDPERQRTIHAPFSLEGGVQGFEELSGTEDGLPTALFASSDEQARGVIAAAGARGMGIPADLAVASVDGTRGGEFSNPPLTSVQQPFAELAELAIGAVLEPAGGADPGHTLVATTLRVRRSCGCSRR
ncbi:MAG: LacI family transcriptional regulator [Streptomyces sp.]|nr:LacI family transcriptional regulator [Streptomyces sp.]